MKIHGEIIVPSSERKEEEAVANSCWTVSCLARWDAFRLSLRECEEYESKFLEVGGFLHKE